MEGVDVNSEMGRKSRGKEDSETGDRMEVSGWGKRLHMDWRGRKLRRDGRWRPPKE